MMKKVFCLVFLFIPAILWSAENRVRELALWYEQPASEWMKATPVGNGRLGAMIFGGTDTETIALNELSLWSGKPDADQELLCGKEQLARIRQLFFDGKIAEGNDLASQYLSGNPHSFGTHLPMGDLKLYFGHDLSGTTDYKRTLDLKQAVTSVSYRRDGVRYTREYFCSNPADVMLIRIAADRKKSIGFEIGVDLLRQANVVCKGDELEFLGTVDYPKFGPGGVGFKGKVKVLPRGGDMTTHHDRLKVSGADEVILIVDIRTNYLTPDFETVCDKAVTRIAQKEYKSVKSEHIADYERLFNRVDLSLGGHDAARQPTDVRLERLKKGSVDPDLYALFFQYGRYLLIASSRENSPLPANLQGVWNDNLACNMEWTCDYHLDINTQQNYWGANVANLAECNTPLFNYIGLLAEHGAGTARKVYGSPGWVAHTVANVWGYTAPGQSVSWGLFPGAGAWIVSHLWSHYLYTKDDRFLRETAYPLLKGSAVFYLDYMVQDPISGYLMTGPGNSPENSFRYKGRELALSMMPTSDRMLMYELFSSCARASRILDIDKPLRDSLLQALDKLPPVKIGKNGQIQEWFEDWEDAHPDHRHATHLLGLYPFNQITPEQTPHLAEAAHKTIDGKLNAEGWEDVEFSRANMINFYARLKDAAKAYNSYELLLKNLVRENLFTMSPKGIAGAPWDIFIFDGNEAAVSGLAEMVIQSHKGYVEFLPALPTQWSNGRFDGLCVQGGGVAGLKWKNGQITDASLGATVAGQFRLLLPDDGRRPQFFRNGKKLPLQADADRLVTVDLAAGDVLGISY